MLAVLLVLLLAIAAIYGGVALNPLLWLLLIVAVFVLVLGTPYVGGGRYRRW